MKNLDLISMFICSVLLFSACSDSSSEDTISGPSKVEVLQIDGKWRLVVNGEEFFVKGGGCDFGPCDEIADHGGNSFRTWNTGNEQMSAEEALDLAYKNGLMVIMGLPVVNERYGMDYDDAEAVKEQLEKLRKEVIRLKDHPALLAWGIGNELNLAYTNIRVWDAVEDIAKMIKEVDGNHPTTTMLAGIWEKEVEYIRENCPSIDFLSIQLYGSLIELDKRIAEAGYDGPYLITEWGARGHWEVETTEWDAPIEETSSERADGIIEKYKKSILGDAENCMGSHVFLWGQKQERTPTWYSIYTEQGEKTEIHTVMEYLWTGEWPDHRPARFNDIFIRGKGGRYDNVRLQPAQEYSAVIDIEQHSESISLRLEITREASEFGFGGSFEPRPETVLEKLISDADIKDISFKSPEQPGPYRLIIYVLDEKGYAAHANLPFLVEDQG